MKTDTHADADQAERIVAAMSDDDKLRITALMQRKGVAGINPLLTEAEHLELFRTVDPFRMVETILQGLNRLQ